MRGNLAAEGPALGGSALPELGPPPRVIEPSHGYVALRLDKLWHYRGLLYFLAWRDVKVRYKQTALGALWAILQPLTTMAIFAVLFGHFAGLKSDGTPYALFCLCGLVPWSLFVFALTQSSNSLVDSANLVSKVAFPRLVIPIAASLAGLIDFAISFLLLIILLVAFQRAPTSAILLLPFFIMLLMAAALAVGIWLSALNVRYRDVRYTIPFLTQIWFFLTPIAYSSNLITGKLHTVMAVNPMNGVVAAFRWSLLGTGGLDGGALVVSTAATLALLVSGLHFFRRQERYFADLV